MVYQTFTAYRGNKFHKRETLTSLSYVKNLSDGAESAGDVLLGLFEMYLGIADQHLARNLG
jgi:hypothetical protein